MIAFGIVVIVLALNGQSTVKSELKNQQITGTPDMTPSAIKAEADKAGLENVDLPTCSVAGEAIDNGTKARCFAQYMNVHALEATGGVRVLADGSVPGEAGHAEVGAVAGRRHEQHRVGGHRPEDEPAGAERRTEHLGDGDGARDRVEHELHGDEPGAVQPRRRDRAPAFRRRRSSCSRSQRCARRRRRMRLSPHQQSLDRHRARQRCAFARSMFISSTIGSGRSRNSCAHGHADDLRVERRATSCSMYQRVELEALRPRDRVAAVHLRPARDAGLHREAALVRLACSSRPARRCRPAGRRGSSRRARR